MIFNSVFGTLYKVSPQEFNLNSDNLNKKELSNFYINLISKSKSQKEKNKINFHKNNNENKNTLKSNKNNINKYNLNNSIIVNNININNIDINKNYINNINNNIEKNDFYQKKQINKIQKKKFSESYILDIRRNRLKKSEDYQNTYLIGKENQKTLRKKQKNVTEDKNVFDDTLSSNINKNDKIFTKFPSLSKPENSLKYNDKQRYQKKFNENYSKLKSFLNHLYFIRKKYKMNNNKSTPNLILNNTKINFDSEFRVNEMKGKINNLMLKFKTSKDLEEKKAINLYMINMYSPIKNYQNNILKKIKYNNINHSYSNNDKNKFTNFISPRKNEKIINIIKKENIEEKPQEFNNLITNNIKNKNQSINFENLIKFRNYNNSLIQSKSSQEMKYLNKIKKYNLITNINLGIKLFPLIKIENFREKYTNENEVEKNFSKKMIEIYFDLSKNINLKSNSLFLDRETYYYKLNKMYNDQLSLYMDHRINWELVETNNDDSIDLFEEQKITVNFEWKYYSNRLNYKKYKYNSSYPLKKLCAINLFEKNYEIGNKKKMFYHLINYCDKVNLNVFNYVPFTIIINNSKFIEEQLEAFKEIYDFIEYQKNKKGNNLNFGKSIIIDKKYNEQFFLDNKIETIKKQYIYINENFLSHKNYWILKPTDLYQGKCIEISNSFDEIYKNCKKIFKGVDKTIKPELKNDEMKHNNKEFINNNKDTLVFPIDDQCDSEGRRRKKASSIYISNEIIIQKYLDKPLLYRKRKFDIRCFALVDWNLNVFFCREGHLKASSLVYDINNINKFIHITNHSFQKKSNKFEQFECGNEISYNEFKNFLMEEKIPLENFTKIINRMKFLVELSFKAVGEKLFKTSKVLSFELFGYDFIIDNEYNPWILEINNNPGLSISSPVIEKIIPRMMDDAFRLTIDKIFNTQYSSECIDKNGEYKSKYKLEGYTDNENIFEFLCNVKDNAI